MNFTFLCLVISEFTCLVYAVYNKDVICVLDKNKQPVCKRVARPDRRNAIDINNNLPSYDPYIPRPNSVLYNCSNVECHVLNLSSVSQVAFPESKLKMCYKQIAEYECDTVEYNNFKTIDKLVFLRNHIPNKLFYLVDCLVYSDGGRVCHKKDNAESHAKLVDTGTMARPKEQSILAPDEFLCEEAENKEINCDNNLFVPFEDGLKIKETTKTNNDVLLKTGSCVVDLKRNCIESWCGFSGHVVLSRRYARYDAPGGKVYKCYYGQKQQVCKELYSKAERPVYNNRDFIMGSTE